MISTVPNLTQSNQKSNKFPLHSGKLARRGLFDKIHTEQWHIYRELKHHTKNLNVINLASLLAVLPRMGIFAYEITQAELAEKMATLFKMESVPARNTISKWENELKKMGLVEIPEHVDWKNTKTKIRVITKKFWDLSRLGLPELSYTCPPVTFCAGKVERVEQVNPKERNNKKLLETEIRGRARDEMLKQQSPAGRAVAGLENKNFQKPEKIAIRPPKNKTGASKKLNRFENSVSHWFFQNKNLESYREGLILIARFLELGRADDYYKKLEINWNDCGDASRPGMISDLIRYLRTVEPANIPEPVRPPLYVVNPAPNPKAPGSDFPASVSGFPADIIADTVDRFDLSAQKTVVELVPEPVPESEPESIHVIQCMINGRQDCDERHIPLVNRFKAARNDEKQYILEHIESLVLIGGKQAVDWLEILRNSSGF